MAPTNERSAEQAGPKTPKHKPPMADGTTALALESCCALQKTLQIFILVASHTHSDERTNDALSVCLARAGLSRYR